MQQHKQQHQVELLGKSKAHLIGSGSSGDHEDLADQKRKYPDGDSACLQGE